MLFLVLHALIILEGFGMDSLENINVIANYLGSPQLTSFLHGVEF